MELLVVITIIGILIALLLPAVQAAREAARRTQCQNNLKQLSLAVLAYESQWRIFPPSSHWPPGVDINQRNPPYLRESWVVMVLPFLEQQALHDSFRLDLPLSHDLNKLARSTELAVVLCPSDTYNHMPFNGSACPLTNQMGDGWARCNYAANACLGYMMRNPAHQPSPGGINMDCAGPDQGWADWRLRGVMGANASIDFAQMKDGASSTVMLAECRAGVVPFDSRGVWAMAGGCPNSLWAHGHIGDCWGPNNLASGACDDTMACSNIQAAVGGWDALRQMGMSCFSGNVNNSQSGARSMHADGLHVCLCDGAVHWISDFIEVSTDYRYYSVWDRLMLSADEYTLSGNAF